tara:strand:+ start:90 stop:557 length:468 start_codon:yes stop_codon:yes gene_type:complete
MRSFWRRDLKKQTQATTNDMNPLDDLKKQTRLVINAGLTAIETVDGLKEIETLDGLKDKTQEAIKKCDNYCIKLKTHLSTLKEYCPEAEDHKHNWEWDHGWHGSSSRCTLCRAAGTYQQKGGSKRVRKSSNKTRKRNTKNGRYNAVHKRKTRRQR